MRTIVITLAAVILSVGPASAICGPFFGTEKDREQSSCFAAPAPVTTPQLSYAPRDAAQGVFVASRIGPERYELVVTAHKLTGESDVEKYLAYRTAKFTIDHRDNWFSFVQQRTRGDIIKPPISDPSQHYDFRLINFQPEWRYQTADSSVWKTWSPFSGKSFLDGTDPSKVTIFEARAVIVLHKGAMPDTNPLAFNAIPLRDLLISEVEPPDSPVPPTGATPQAKSLVPP